MKRSVCILSLLLAIGLSSFNINSNTSSKSNSTVKQSGTIEYCAIYGATSVTRNGVEIGNDLSSYLFYFCSDNVFSIYTPTVVYEGIWYQKDKNLVISVAASEEGLDWVDGEWIIQEQTEDLLVLQQTDKDGELVARFERRQR